MNICHLNRTPFTEGFSTDYRKNQTQSILNYPVILSGDDRLDN